MWSSTESNGARFACRRRWPSPRRNSSGCPHRGRLGDARARQRAAPRVDGRLAWIALAGVLAGALALRLWGVKQGLPYAYNTDEADHFVPRAVSMFGASLNPHYFQNPPAFTYLLHWLFAVAYGGGAGVRRT